MLPRVNRLRSSDEIREVVNRGKRITSKLATLHYLPAETNRFAIVVSKAVGGAVVRNQVKRRIRAVLSGQTAHSPAISGVVRVRPGADRMSYQQVDSQLVEILEQIR